METLLRRLLWCFGTRHRHRKGKPWHRHDRPRGGTGTETDGARRSFYRPTRPSSAAARFRRSAAPTIQASGADNNQEFSFSRERAAAAATIQAHFRGHLARQAFCALRSLVKLQAFARGAYVRKQASIAIRCMNVLVRLQVRARSRQLRHAQRRNNR